MNANEIQHGGDHYRQHGGEMQHWDFVAVAGLGYHDGNATKYVDRYRRKAGRQDLMKAGHYCLKCHELRMMPPQGGRGMAALIDYTAGRQDLSAQQVGILQLIVGGEYLMARDAIARLADEEYPQD